MKEPQMLEFAAEQFVGKTQRDLEEIILQTIEGHFRAILGLCHVYPIWKSNLWLGSMLEYISVSRLFTHAHPDMCSWPQ
jgi:hypothetical protein